MARSPPTRSISRTDPDKPSHYYQLVRRIVMTFPKCPERALILASPCDLAYGIENSPPWSWHQISFFLHLENLETIMYLLMDFRKTYAKAYLDGLPSPIGVKPWTVFVIIFQKRGVSYMSCIITGVASHFIMPILKELLTENNNLNVKMIDPIHPKAAGRNEIPPIGHKK